jgi:2-phosphosulfolactate phosphatase
MDNSPSKLALLSHFVGPVVLLSSSGTVLMHEARKCAVSYVACFRNFDATARYICGRHRSVAIIGAGSRGEFREEDQMCCAWMARHLVEQGYKAKNRHTEELVERWRGVPPSACAGGKSATFLRSTGQSKDLDFVLTHVNDLDGVYTMQKGEVVALYRAGAVTQKRHEYISKTGRAMVSA